MLDCCCIHSLSWKRLALAVWNLVPSSGSFLLVLGPDSRVITVWVGAGVVVVALWSSHLDPASDVMIDISPASLRNLDLSLFPKTIEELRFFYDDLEGGDPGRGYYLNPVTRMPYEPQIVPLSDYARVLAEF